MVDDPDKYLAGLDMTDSDLNKIKDSLKNIDKSKLKNQMEDYFDSEEYAEGEGENDDEFDNENGTKTKLKDMDDEVETDEQGNKKKLKNPAKIWKRRKKKNGNGSTKNYYNKDGDSLSQEEYKDVVERYKDALKKKKSNTKTQSTQDNQSSTETQSTQDNQSLLAYIANLSENKQTIRHINNFILR